MPRLEDLNHFIEEVDRRKEEIPPFAEKEEGDYELACDLVADLRRVKLDEVSGLVSATRNFLSIYGIQINVNI